MMAQQHQSAPSSAEQCAQLLTKPRKTPNGWKACCPAHEDSNPSLFLADGEDGVALVCYAGCDYKSIVQALEARGAVFKIASDRGGIFSEHFQLGAYHSFWDYRDAQGRVTMRICRWEQPGGKKDIRPLIKTLDGWKWAHHPNPRPLFQLDRLTNEPELPVLLVEGEKTAVAAQKLFASHIATTWPGGAAATGQVDLAPLKGREVILVPDCDPPGRKAMAWLFQHLKGIANVRVVDPARALGALPEGWDLADALTEKRDVTSLLSKERIQPRLIELGFMVDEAKTHIELPYLVKGLFDRGQLIVLWGAPGSGKTFAALHLSCHVGAGRAWVGRRVRAGAVLYVCAESTRARLENRISALCEVVPEVKHSSVFFVALQMDLLQGEADIMDVIEAAKSWPDIAMIVIDTLAVTFGSGNENAPEDMNQYVSNIKRIKTETNAAVMVVHHSGKDESRGMRGHSALIGAIDAELSVEKLEAVPGQPSRVLKAGKLREGSSYTELFAFDLEVRSLGLDSDGDAVTTCVVMPSSISGRSRRPSAGTQAKLLQALEAAQKAGSVSWNRTEIGALCAGLMSRNMVTGAIIGLTNSGFLSASIGGYVLNDVSAR